MLRCMLHYALLLLVYACGDTVHMCCVSVCSHTNGWQDKEFRPVREVRPTLRQLQEHACVRRIAHRLALSVSSLAPSQLKSLVAGIRPGQRGQHDICGLVSADFAADEVALVCLKQRWALNGLVVQACTAQAQSNP